VIFASIQINSLHFEKNTFLGQRYEHGHGVGAGVLGIGK
jgi:hypothetical protein